MSMTRMAGGINPDSNIKVAAVFPNGHLKIYEAVRKGQVVRSYLYSRSFSTYGKAKLWAAEFEQKNREMKQKEKPE